MLAIIYQGEEMASNAEIAGAAAAIIGGGLIIYYLMSKKSTTTTSGGTSAAPQISLSTTNFTYVD